MTDAWTDFLAAKGISNRDLAERSNLSLSTVIGLASGKHRPQKGKLRKLAMALEVPADDLRGMLSAQREVGREDVHRRALRSAVTRMHVIAKNPSAYDGNLKLLEKRLDAVVVAAKAARAAITARAETVCLTSAE